VLGSQDFGYRDGEVFGLVMPTPQPPPPVKGHRDHEIHAEGLEPRREVPGPHATDALAKCFPRPALHGENHVPQKPVIGAQSNGRIEVKPFVPTVRAAIRYVGVLAHGARASWAGKVRILD
jgi:hypothetical protein